MRKKEIGKGDTEERLDMVAEMERNEYRKHLRGETSWWGSDDHPFSDKTAAERLGWWKATQKRWEWLTSKGEDCPDTCNVPDCATCYTYPPPKRREAVLATRQRYQKEK